MNIVGAVIGVIIGVILVGVVGYPLVKSSLNATALGATGSDATMMTVIPTLLLVGLVVLVAAGFIGGAMR